MNETKQIVQSQVGLSDHNKIIYIVSICCQVDKELLLAANKGKREICDARHIAVYLMRYETKYTFAKISGILKRNTNSLHNSLRVVPVLYEREIEFSRQFDICKEMVNKYLN